MAMYILVIYGCAVLKTKDRKEKKSYIYDCAVHIREYWQHNYATLIMCILIAVLRIIYLMKNNHQLYEDTRKRSHQ